MYCNPPDGGIMVETRYRRPMVMKNKKPPFGITNATPFTSNSSILIMLVPVTLPRQEPGFRNDNELFCPSPSQYTALRCAHIFLSIFYNFLIISFTKLAFFKIKPCFLRFCIAAGSVGGQMAKKSAPYELRSIPVKAGRRGGKTGWK